MTVHALQPGTAQVLCGEKTFYANALYREQVTCDKCKKHPEFKNVVKKMPIAMARTYGFRKKKRQ